jgi:TIR domain
MKSRDANRTINYEGLCKKIVCIYTQNDEPFYSNLQTYLSLWQREGYIQWLETPAGSDVESTMQAHLQQADLILLLIGPDFFAQDHCYSTMKTSLQEHARRQVPVVPILARASAWKESACGSLHALPGNEQPIVQWVHQEQAYEEIRSGLVHLLPGDDEYREKLIQETAHPGAEPSAHQMREGTLNFVNTASNKGQQGVFNAPINNSYQ